MLLMSYFTASRLLSCAAQSVMSGLFWEKLNVCLPCVKMFSYINRTFVLLFSICPLTHAGPFFLVVACSADMMHKLWLSVS